MPKTQFLMLTVYADTDHIFSALSGRRERIFAEGTGQKELIASLKLTMRVAPP